MTIPFFLRVPLHAPYARLAALSSIGVTAAYAFGSYLPVVNAQVAAITALVAVRSTFHASTQEAMRQTLGLVLGAVFALLLITTIGSAPRLCSSECSPVGRRPACCVWASRALSASP